MSEKDWIARYFAPLATASGAAGLTDDVALLATPGPMIVTQDAIVEGVHFRATDPIETVARKLVRANVSDVLAKGCRPAQGVLTVGWPGARPESELAAFAKALGDEFAHWGIELIGGDTVASPNGLFLSLTLTGACIGSAPIRRSGAGAGDEVWVTGTIGGAKRGFDGDPQWLDAYQQPSIPPIEVADLIAAHATASIDVSDGLFGDADAVALASDMGIILTLDSVPFAGNPVDLDTQIDLATWGDDYQSLFTAPASAHAAIAQWANEYGVKLSNIGHIQAGSGLQVYAKGEQINLPETLGFEHG